MIGEGNGELWEMVTGEESNRNRIEMKCEIIQDYQCFESSPVGQSPEFQYIKYSRE